MIDWITAGKLAAQAGQAFMQHLQNRNDEDAREADRDLILAAVAGVQTRILERFDELEIDVLRGELEGFRLTYSAYEPDPADPQEETRLVTLIDDSARVIGRLGAHLDSLAESPGLALEAWTVYTPLVFLRAQAMAEREATYGGHEARDALPSFDAAGPRLQALLQHLRRISDARFGPVVCRPMQDSQDSRVCWYVWRHGQHSSEQVICGSTSQPDGVQRCQQSRERTMRSAYVRWPGVTEISAAAEQLDVARDALAARAALDRLSRTGLSTPAGRFVHGRLAVADLGLGDPGATAPI